MEKMRQVLHEILGKELTSSEVLRGARIEAGISQEELEEITGIKRSNISALENNRMGMTSHYAEILGAALKVHPADLLYPNRKITKSEEILKIEERAEAVMKRHAAS
jgi:transcriptional regulator with XRE-family HTH domain